MKVSSCTRHTMSLPALAYSLSVSLWHVAYEPLGYITDPSNLNLFPKLNFPYSVHFNPSTKGFPLSVKYFPTLVQEVRIWVSPLILPFPSPSPQYFIKFCQLYLRMYLPHHLRLGHHHPPTYTHCRSFQLCPSLLHSTFTCARGV